jgi:hypothetical protein
VLLSLDSTAANRIADTPSLVLLAERCLPAAKAAVRETFEAVARAWEGEQRGGGGSERELLFFDGSKASGRVSKALRAQLGLERASRVAPTVVLIDQYVLFNFNAYCLHTGVAASASEIVAKGLALPGSGGGGGGDGGGGGGDSGGDNGGDAPAAAAATAAAAGAAGGGDVTECPLYTFLTQFSDGELPKVVRTDDYKARSAAVLQARQHAAAGDEAAGDEPMDSEQYDSDGVAFSF